MNRPNPGRKLAILATAASLAGATAALAPTAASARAGGAQAAKSCGSKTIAVKPAGGKKVQVAASRIKVSGGATCAQAYTVIGAYVQHKSAAGWKVKEGTFKVPHGLTAETATKGKKTIEFALVGGRESD